MLRFAPPEAQKDSAWDESVGSNPGLEAAYTEQASVMSKVGGSDTGLENRCTGNRTVGSNPTLSASN